MKIAPNLDLHAEYNINFTCIHAFNFLHGSTNVIHVVRIYIKTEKNHKV